MASRILTTVSLYLPFLFLLSETYNVQLLHIITNLVSERMLMKMLKMNFKRHLAFGLQCNFEFHMNTLKLRKKVYSNPI